MNLRPHWRRSCQSKLLLSEHLPTTPACRNCTAMNESLFQDSRYGREASFTAITVTHSPASCALVLPKEPWKEAAATPAKHRNRTTPQPRRPYLLLPPHGPPSERGRGTGGGPGGGEKGAGPARHRTPGSAPGARLSRSCRAALPPPGGRKARRRRAGGTALPALPACSKQNNFNSRVGENNALQQRAILLTKRQWVSAGAVTDRTQRGTRTAPQRPSRGRPFPQRPSAPAAGGIRCARAPAPAAFRPPGRTERLTSGSEGLCFSSY